MSDAWRAVWNQFPNTGVIHRVEPMANAGGFSGAKLWRITTSGGVWCLRRWPAETKVDLLQFIHQVLQHVGRMGIRFVPLPMPNRSGESFLRHDGAFWEATPWMPGTASYRTCPSESKLRGAMRALAEFHRAAASLFVSQNGLSPGLNERREAIRQLLTGKSIVAGNAWPEFDLRAREIAARSPAVLPAIALLVEQTAGANVPLQPCIRDVWHDHVLFEGDHVSGLVDFGALRIETVAGDVARLLGSFVADDEQGWRIGLAAYQELRPLSPDEMRLVTAFDRSAVVLSGLNWLRWVYEEEREFSDRSAVVGRLDEILSRLRNAAGHFV